MAQEIDLAINIQEPRVTCDLMPYAVTCKISKQHNIGVALSNISLQTEENDYMIISDINNDKYKITVAIDSILESNSVDRRIPVTIITDEKYLILKDDDGIYWKIMATSDGLLETTYIGPVKP